ncbi:MAG: alpha-glucosidase [Chitinophagaceae bacterium]|nr:alpha-glucosidase [Chitinophagaceae bacterium]
MKNISLLAIALFIIIACAHKKIRKEESKKDWWKEEIVYQIYPRSFKDSNGDGVGDLKGIISELDYLKSLGITAIWLNPIYESPNDDNGYDVSDYRKILGEFGTMEDFDALLKGLHDRNIKLVMDLVVNHSSDEHEWFKQSKSSRDSKYRNYYHWWNAERGTPPYRYSLFDINHDAWKYDAATNAYYLHYFSRKQPDLNWENPALRNEIYEIMKFWADKGIDGFRLDAFGFASKDTSFPIFPKGFEKNFMLYYSMGPHLHEYLQEMNKEVLSKYKLMSVAEGAGNSFKDAHDLVDANRNELNMAYAFEGVDIPKASGFSLLHFKEVYSRWDSAFANNGWLSIFLANHDQARMVTRFGNDNPAFREKSSMLLTTFIMTMRGTPYYYNGDELGMTNAYFTDIKQYKDMPTRNEYQFQLKQGADMSAFMKKIQFECRDNGRTPFQWDSTVNAGFTSGKPWLSINPNYKTINKAIQDKDPNSVLSYFRKIVTIRKSNPILVHGKYTLLDKENPTVYAYTREWEGKKWLILLNFSTTESSVKIGYNYRTKKQIINNYNVVTTSEKLRPYEAVVYEL